MRVFKWLEYDLLVQWLKVKWKTLYLLENLGSNPYSRQPFSFIELVSNEGYILYNLSQ